MENIDKGTINKKTIAIILIIAIIVGAGLSLRNNGGNDAKKLVPVVKTRENPQAIALVEGETIGKEYQLPGNLTEIIWELGWTDDEGAESEPDTFEFTVFAEGFNEVEQATNEMGGNAHISFTFSCNDTGDEYLPSTWEYSIRCIETGDTPAGPLGVIVNNDPGNVVHLYVSWQYIEYEEEEI